MRKNFKKVMASLLALTLAITPVAIPKEVKAESNMPSAVDLSTSPYFPEIENQGQVGCCVAMSEVYYQFTYEMNKSMNVPSTRDNVFSPYAIYNMFDTDNGSGGIQISECYDVLKDYGGLLWKDLNFDISTDNSYAYAYNTIWAKRSNYRISETNTLDTNNYADKINYLKKALVNEKVVSATTISRNWKLGTIQDSSNGSSNHLLAGERIIYDMAPADTGHRITFVGYDDNIWFDSDHDGEVDEGEMGAFKFANSWSEAWGNKGYCWMTYASIKSNPSIAKDLSTINVMSYNSDSDIKLLVDMNSDMLADSTLTLTAYSKYSDEKFSKSLAPFTTYYDISKSVQTYRSFSTYNNRGILAYDLDMLIPDMNSDNFNNYYYELNVSDKGLYEGTTTLNSAYIYDYNRSMKVGTFDCTKEALSGNELSLPMINLIDNSYDFSVTDLQYTNQTNIETGCPSKDVIMVGDTLKLSSTIKNVGSAQAPADKKLKVLYTVTDENGNAVDVPNVWSDNYVNNPVLKPLKSVELTSNTGGSNGNGTISFSKPGTYKITAWVNAENDFPDESGGINSTNNKRTITVDVEPYKPFELDSWNVSDTNIYVGDTVTVSGYLKKYVDCEMTLSVLTISYYQYKSTSANHYSASITFDNEGTYLLSATLKCKDSKKYYTYSTRINVYKPLTVGKLTSDTLTNTNNKVKMNDTINFKVNDVNKSNVATKIITYSPWDKYRTPLDETDFVSGTSVDLKVTQTGQLCAYAIVKDLDSGKTTEVKFDDVFKCYETVGGYDFAVKQLTCENYTTGKNTIYYSDGTMNNYYSNDIHVGDKIKFGATVYNVGDVTSDSGKKLGVQFQINGNTSDITWCDSFYNPNGLLPISGSNNGVYLLACGGSVNKEGYVTFSQPGTYNITAWVNDTNDYASEYGGYQADNNKVTFKIVVK